MRSWCCYKVVCKLAIPSIKVWQLLYLSKSYSQFTSANGGQSFSSQHESNQKQLWNNFINHKLATFQALTCFNVMFHFPIAEFCLIFVSSVLYSHIHCNLLSELIILVFFQKNIPVKFQHFFILYIYIISLTLFVNLIIKWK